MNTLDPGGTDGHQSIPGLVVTPPRPANPAADGDAVGAWQEWGPAAGPWTLGVLAGRIAAFWTDRRAEAPPGRTVVSAIDAPARVLVPAGVSFRYRVVGGPVELSVMVGGDAAGATTRSDERFRVLFVCTANICRSAYADLAANMRPHAGLEFSSAGIHAFVGRPIDPPMAACLDNPDVASGHRAKQLTRADVADADLIVTMAAEHRRYILEEWPDLGRKVFVVGHVTRELQRIPDDLRLADLADHLWRRRTVDPDDDVPDPYRRGPDTSLAVSRRIDAHLDVLLDVLTRLRSSA